MITPDRISYSYSFKISENYSSESVHLSVSTDVSETETVAQAMERAREFVHAQAAIDGQQTKTAMPVKAPNIDAERFDPTNPVHVRIAYAIFDQERIASPKQRGFMLNNTLRGLMVGEIGRAVRDDIEKFNRERSNVTRGGFGRWRGGAR